MTEITFRSLLNKIADELRDTDLQRLKYLCHGKIGAGELERATSAIEFLRLLQQREMISKDDASFLEELLYQAQRRDLASRVRTSGCTRMETESGAPMGETLADTKFRRLLSNLSDELTKRDLDSLKFLLGLPASISEKTASGHQLFMYLQKKGEIGPCNLDTLQETLADIHRRDLSKKIGEYKETRGAVPPITYPSGSSTRQPSIHSKLPLARPQPTPISPGLPLLRPEDFKKKAYSNPSGLPSSSSDPRFPVQCEEAVMPLDELDEMPAYPMTSRPRGICLIISNQHFDKPELRKRDGNEQDVENLKRTFENLHFVVEIRQDKTASEMYTIAREFSSIDHSAYDLFVCCILSHGMLGSIYGSDSNLIEINEISSQFKGNACPTLAHKPKLFFIQACRGQDFDRGIQADATRDMDASDAVRQNAEPNESHFLLGYATPPGYVSWRSQVHGSWYISFLCEVLSTYCERYDLVTMMVKVNDKVSEAFTRKGYKQCPAPVVTLRKRIYLNEN